MDKLAATGKFIIFKINNYILGLPIATVLKVVNYPPINREHSDAGLIHIGQHTITLLNLHQKLGSSYNSLVNRNSPFLIITQLLQGELCAIPVDEPPSLVELSRDSVRALPKSYQHDSLQDLVKCVAVLTEAEKKSTIFILDINRALSTTNNLTTPRLITIEA